LMWWYWW